MSPAGSGRGQFREGLVASVSQPDLRALDDDPRECGLVLAPVSWWAWMLPCLLPIGLAGMVALISLSGALGYALAAVWGWIVFPCIAVYARRRALSSRREDDAQYWRTRMM